MQSLQAAMAVRFAISPVRIGWRSTVAGDIRRTIMNNQDPSGFHTFHGKAKDQSVTRHGICVFTMKKTPGPSANWSNLHSNPLPSLCKRFVSKMAGRLLIEDQDRTRWIWLLVRLVVHGFNILKETLLILEISCPMCPIFLCERLIHLTETNSRFLRQTASRI